jgi:hypothetical protein
MVSNGHTAPSGVHDFVNITVTLKRRGSERSEFEAR